MELELSEKGGSFLIMGWERAIEAFLGGILPGERKIILFRFINELLGENVSKQITYFRCIEIGRD